MSPLRSPGSPPERSQVSSGGRRGGGTEGGGTSVLGELQGTLVNPGGDRVRDLRQELLWPDFLGWFDSWKRGFTGQQRGDLADNHRGDFVDNCRVLLPGREGEMAHERAYFDISRSHESLFHPLNMIESLALQRHEPGFQC